MSEIQMNRILSSARIKASAQGRSLVTEHMKNQIFGNNKKVSGSGKDFYYRSTANRGEVSSKTAHELTQENKYLNVAKTAATDLRKRANNLALTNITSMFGQAKATGHRESLLSEIKVFLSDYNTMIENAGKVDSKTMEKIRKECMAYGEMYQDKLNKVGIHQNTDGTMAIAKQILENADLSKLEEVFSGTDSFAGKVFQKSILVESNAIATINRNKYAIPADAPGQGKPGSSGGKSTMDLVKLFLSKWK